MTAKALELYAALLYEQEGLLSLASTRISDQIPEVQRNIIYKQ